jgi:ubiquinone/menaquinone biosynthesis C-methylase UbiE
MDRKRYMRDIYSKHWATVREEIYGFSEYSKNLCKYICEEIPEASKLLEVAIGTGDPFADYFQKSGYSVYGIDISPALIDRCQQLYPNIISKVCDAENLDYSNEYFDCSYCFHSTWYFPDLIKVIDEMIRVTLPGGLVMFDIQNRNNKELEEAYQKRIRNATGLRKFTRYAKNIAKLILRRGTPNWHFVVHEVPTYPESIYSYLKEQYIEDFKVMVLKGDKSFETRKEHDSFRDFQRLVFVVRK